MKTVYKYCGIALLTMAMCFGTVGCGNDSRTSSGTMVSSMSPEEMEKDRQEKQKKVDHLYAFIKSAKKKYDQAQQITWVDSVNNLQFGHKGIYTYMGIDGKDQTGKKWLRAKIHYSGSDWVFFNKVIFSNTEETWTYQMSELRMLQEKKDDVVWGGVHETLDVAFDDISRGLEILANGKNPRIDFYGSGGHVGKQVTKAELKNIKNYLKLKEGIEAEDALRKN